MDNCECICDPEVCVGCWKSPWWWIKKLVICRFSRPERSLNKYNKPRENDKQI